MSWLMSSANQDLGFRNQCVNVVLKFSMAPGILHCRRGTQSWKLSDMGHVGLQRDARNAPDSDAMFSEISLNFIWTGFFWNDSRPQQ